MYICLYNSAANFWSMSFLWKYLHIVFRGPGGLFYRGDHDLSRVSDLYGVERSQLAALRIRIASIMCSELPQLPQGFQYGQALQYGSNLHFSIYKYLLVLQLYFSTLVLELVLQFHKGKVLPKMTPLPFIVKFIPHIFSYGSCKQLLHYLQRL